MRKMELWKFMTVGCVVLAAGMLSGCFGGKVSASSGKIANSEEERTEAVEPGNAFHVMSDRKLDGWLCESGGLERQNGAVKSCEGAFDLMVRLPDCLPDSVLLKVEYPAEIKSTQEGRIRVSVQAKDTLFPSQTKEVCVCVSEDVSLGCPGFYTCDTRALAFKFDSNVGDEFDLPSFRDGTSVDFTSVTIDVARIGTGLVREIPQKDSKSAAQDEKPQVDTADRKPKKPESASKKTDSSLEHEGQSATESEKRRFH